MNILLLGSGGREHAMAWKLAQSPLCSKLYVAPGNAGTAMHGENVAMKISDFSALGDFSVRHDVDMVVAGPEEPLVKGIADYFARDEALKNILFVGPSASGARLEGSKAFAKGFMQRHSIPTAAYRSFTAETIQSGIDYLKKKPAPYVLKADGLAAGKGVIICNSLQEATRTLEEMLGSQLFGEASDTVVVEEFLSGMEVSVFVLTDGHSYVMLPEAKDYKRVGEGDTGPNTGGMGAISPVGFADKVFMQKVEERIIHPTIKGLEKEGIRYCGFIFFGLIEVKQEPYVIEYNVRLGDPEAQAILPRLQSDFAELLHAAAKGKLHEVHAAINPAHAATVVLASGGYPGNYSKGYDISINSPIHNSQLFYAGVHADQEGLKTSGGRVMAITSLDEKLSTAVELSYQGARLVDFKGKYYRRDIGRDLLKS